MTIDRQPCHICPTSSLAQTLQRKTIRLRRGPRFEIVCSVVNGLYALWRSSAGESGACMAAPPLSGSHSRFPRLSCAMEAEHRGIANLSFAQHCESPDSNGGGLWSVCLEASYRVEIAKQFAHHLKQLH
eukprot:472369-Amphidinium_carterae.1